MEKNASEGQYLDREKVAASYYATISSYYFSSYRRDLEKNGFVKTYNGKIYKDMQQLKEEIKSQMIHFYNSKELEQDISLDEMLQIVFA